MDNKSRIIRPSIASGQLEPLTLTEQSSRLDRQDGPTWLRSRHALLLIILVCLAFTLVTFCTNFVNLQIDYGPARFSGQAVSPHIVRVYLTSHVWWATHFIYLANAWLQGYLYVADPGPGWRGDYTFWNGQWYVAFPPLPAVFLLPLVAIFHYDHQFEISLGVVFTFGIANIILIFLVLRRLVEKYQRQLLFSSVAWLLVFFVFGTELLYVSMQIFTAHVIATTFLLLHVLELLGKRRAWLAALWLGLAALSRSTAILAFPCYLLLIFLEERQQPWLLLRKYSAFCGVLGIFVGGMLLYNLVRFGSWLDFGYMSMNVSPPLVGVLHQYGQFSLHFLAKNFHYMFIQPPQILTQLPYILFNPIGVGIFWTMPALYSVFRTFFVRSHNYLAWSLLAGCILPLIALLLYYNTGWVQFGSRFFVDILPFVLVLAVMGFHDRLRWYEKSLILLSIGINVWGVLEYAYFAPFVTQQNTP